MYMFVMGAIEIYRWWWWWWFGRNIRPCYNATSTSGLLFWH